jgi:hypothetical protein
LPKCKTIKPHLTQILLSIFDYPIQHYDIEVFPYQDHGEEVEDMGLKAKQEVEEKTRS